MFTNESQGTLIRILPWVSWTIVVFLLMEGFFISANAFTINPAVCCSKLRKQKESLTFMTVNVCIRNNLEPENHWSRRLSRIRSMIYSYESGRGPHIIGMQEVSSGFWEDLKRELPDYDSRYEDRGGNDDEGTALFFNPERIDYLEGGEIYISRSHSKHCGGCDGKSAGRAAKHRNVIWARFQDKRTQHTFYVYNAHFGGGVCHKSGSALIVAEHIATRRFPGEPTIVLGDFNTGLLPDGALQEAYQVLLRHTDLDNSFLAVHDPAETESVSTINDPIENVRDREMIDHIMFSPAFEVIDADIDRTMIASDGSPVDCFTTDSRGRCISRNGDHTSFHAANLQMYSDHWAVWSRLYLSGINENVEASTLHLLSLTCNDALESEDEVYLKVDGRKIWGPFTMDNGGDLGRRHIGLRLPIEDFAFIELWEEDRPRDNPEKDNKIGCSITVPRHSQFNGTMIPAIFSQDRGVTGDAKYTLEFLVE